MSCSKTDRERGLTSERSDEGPDDEDEAQVLVMKIVDSGLSGDQREHHSSSEPESRDDAAHDHVEAARCALDEEREGGQKLARFAP